MVEPDGIFGLELVADLPAWGEYAQAGQPARPSQARRRQVTLVESVRQDRAEGPDDLRPGVHRTARPGRPRRHRFALTFRTLSVPQMSRRLEAAGFAVEALLGDYQGGPWDPRADVWIILARKV